MNTDPSEADDAAPGAGIEKRAGVGPVWYALLFGPPFKLIGFFYRTYTSNRKRIAHFASSARVSTAIRYTFALTLLLWILIWLLAPEESRDRLTEALRQNFKTLEKTFSD